MSVDKEKSSLELKREKEDAIVGAIEKWMKFRLNSNNKLSKKEVTNEEGIFIEGMRFEEWMKFELQEDYKLKRKTVKNDDDLSIHWSKGFEFEEDDTIIIVGASSQKEWKKSHSATDIIFEVERWWKKVKNNPGDKEVISFTFTAKKFVEIFQPIADIEVMWIQKFKFRRDDTIEVIETVPQEWDEGKKRKSVVFHVIRNKKKVVDTTGKELEFTFYWLIFLQRFEGISDIKDIVERVKWSIDDKIKKKK